MKTQMETCRPSLLLSLMTQPVRLILDQSGNVNVDDILAVISAFNSPDPSGDATLDGWVDVNDILAIINAWGPCP